MFQIFWDTQYIQPGSHLKESGMPSFGVKKHIEMSNFSIGH